MQQGATGNLTPYVTSSFGKHGLTPTVGIFSEIISGVWKLTLAKILDVFGRPQGYFLSIVLTTVGLVMMAACKNVETYAAAQVFYRVVCEHRRRRLLSSIPPQTSNSTIGFQWPGL